MRRCALFRCILPCLNISRSIKQLRQCNQMEFDGKSWRHPFLRTTGISSLVPEHSEAVATFHSSRLLAFCLILSNNQSVDQVSHLDHSIRQLRHDFGAPRAYFGQQAGRQETRYLTPSSLIKVFPILHRHFNYHQPLLKIER